MASTPVATNTLLTSSPGTVYTPTTGSSCWIDGLTISNTGGADAIIEIWRGNSTTDSVALPAKTLAAGDSYAVKELIGHWLLDGVSLTAKADTAGVCALIFSGREFVSA